MSTIGLRSLLAYKAAMNVTTLNLANVDTPFYSRRQVQLVESMFKNGVDVGSVRRVYDEYISKQLRSATNTKGMNDFMHQQLSQIEVMLQSDKDSVNVYLQDALKSLRELNGNVTDATNRPMFFGKLVAMAGRFNSLGNQLLQEQINSNSSITNSVNVVNKLATEIASINQQIANSSQVDNDALLDQQEKLLQELAKNIDYSSYRGENGQINITLNNGVNLVYGTGATSLSTSANPANPDKLIITAQTTSGLIDITDSIQGGAIAGIYSALTSIQQARAALDKVAMNIADLFNQQNAAGVDAYGNLGAKIFNDINSATAQSSRAYANSTNKGSEQITVSINQSSALTGSDYILNFDTANHYTLTRASDHTVVSSGAVGTLPQVITADGFSTTIGNTPITAGDQFTITPTKNGAKSLSVQLTDPKLLALAFPVITSKNTNNKGNGEIDVRDITDITNSSFSIPGQLNPPITIQFLTAQTYQIVNANTNTVIEGPITYNAQLGADVFPTPGGYDPGYRIHLEKDMQAQDSFNIGYNSNGIGNQNGLKFEGLFATGQFIDNYHILANNFSLDVNQAKISSETSKILEDQALARYSQVSGVSLEEELQNISLYREAYEASAKILDVANEVFKILIGISGG